MDFHRIVVIPWDGIETEVISEGMKDDKTLAPEGKEVIGIRIEAGYWHFAGNKLGSWEVLHG